MIIVSASPSAGDEAAQIVHAHDEVVDAESCVLLCLGQTGGRFEHEADPVGETNLCRRGQPLLHLCHTADVWKDDVEVSERPREFRDQTEFERERLRQAGSRLIPLMPTVGNSSTMYASLPSSMLISLPSQNRYQTGRPANFASTSSTYDWRLLWPTESAR